MIRAAIDVGSNTVRMLLAKRVDSLLLSPQYYRQVTRLAGELNPATGLAPQSIERTLQALEQFSKILSQHQITDITTVGTAALRNASNSDFFIKQLSYRTGLDLEIIDGETEAGLSCGGILSVLDPPPKRALLFDVGGGSTEIILFSQGEICLQKSLNLGAVRLCESYLDPNSRQKAIQQELLVFAAEPVWREWQRDGISVELVGTAGTVTTMAAVKLKMAKYDGSRVNNLILERCWLNEMTTYLTDLTLEQRQVLPGMEKGRGDIIVPGLQIVCELLDLVGSKSLRAADAGLLEGILLKTT